MLFSSRAIIDLYKACSKNNTNEIQNFYGEYYKILSFLQL